MVKNWINHNNVAMETSIQEAVCRQSTIRVWMGGEEQSTKTKYIQNLWKTRMWYLLAHQQRDVRPPHMGNANWTTGMKVRKGSV